MPKLSPPRQAFVEHYLRTWNATEAARLAGYAAPNKQGPRLLVNVGIQAAIQARLDELKLGADEVLVRLGQQARGEYAQYIYTFSPDGKTRLPAFDFEACAADGNLHLVRKWRYDARGNLEIEFYDAQNALVQLGRHHKLFTDRAEIPGLEALKAYIGISPDDWDEEENGDADASAPVAT